MNTALNTKKKKSTLNNIINWVISQFIKIQKEIDKVEDINKIDIPRYLSIREILSVSGKTYSQLINYNIYYVLNKRFTALRYIKNQGKFRIKPEKIEKDLENKNEKFL